MQRKIDYSSARIIAQSYKKNLTFANLEGRNVGESEILSENRQKSRLNRVETEEKGNECRHIMPGIWTTLWAALRADVRIQFGRNKQRRGSGEPCPRVRQGIARTERFALIKAQPASALPTANSI